jgi:hypothetical protein
VLKERTDRGANIDLLRIEYYNMLMRKSITERARSFFAGSSRQSGEIAPEPDRVVLFGTNLVGTPAFGALLQDFLNEYGASYAKVEYTRHTEHIEDTFYGRSIDNPDARPTIPRGVIVFPGEGMMQDMNGRDRMMRVPMPVDYIQELCDRHAVPLVRFEQGASPEAVSRGLGALASLQIPQIER